MRETCNDLAQRLAEAAAWHMRLHEAEVETTPEFEAWLAESENAAAWAETVALWDFLGDRSRDSEMVVARQEALGAARRSLKQRRRSIPTWRTWHVAAACVLVAAIGWGGYVWLQQPDDYATAFGERRMVVLKDGSQISLDFDSEVTVRYSKSVRELRLLHGQARFDVAHDVERPFSVTARDEKIVATGTAFNVDMTQSKVLVTLIEGRIVVLDESGSPITQPVQAKALVAVENPRRVELHAGQQLAALPGRPPEIKPANVQKVTAWTSGQLIFTDEPLSEVVARVNRYSDVPIVISDIKIGGERVSGLFNTGDVPGFLNIVTQYLPIHAITDDNGRIILQKNDKSTAE